MNKKAQAFTFLIFIIGILILGLAISALMKPMKTVYDSTYNKSDVMDADYQQFYTRTKTVWIWLPFILGIPMVAWVLIKAHEKNKYG